jgi:hypothetical protein
MIGMMTDMDWAEGCDRGDGESGRWLGVRSDRGLSRVKRLTRKTHKCDRLCSSRFVIGFLVRGKRAGARKS